MFSCSERVFQWAGPGLALAIITEIIICSTYSALQVWNLPASVVPYMRGVHFYTMYIWVLPILWNFFKAMQGPGYAPLGWKPKNVEDEQCLQYCKECRGFKPPRAHHCKKCKRCVLKMDHHCPWINACVGHFNQTNFILFLFFVPLCCIHAIIVNSNFMYNLLNYQFSFHQPYFKITISWILLVITGISFGGGTALGVLILLLTQCENCFTYSEGSGGNTSPSTATTLWSIRNNRTQIEDWIVEKAKQRRKMNKLLTHFEYPYNLGCCRNFIQVINCYCKPKGNGINWPVKKGCHKYSFTLEQLEQKRLKKRRSVTCRVRSPYNGSCCPLCSQGLMTALCMPRCGDPTIAVSEGYIMVITRWDTYWVYGSKLLHKDDLDAKELKGWFPRNVIKPTLSTRSKSPNITISNARASSYSDSQCSDSEEEISDCGNMPTKSLHESPKLKKKSSGLKQSPINVPVTGDGSPRLKSTEHGSKDEHSSKRRNDSVLPAGARKRKY